MNKTAVSTKYASLRQALEPTAKKASAWVRGHRRALSWMTSLVAFVGLTWTLSNHGGWASLSKATLARGHCLAIAALLWPVNIGLEAWKWRRLTSDALASGGMRTWAVAWKEVLVGQTWALLGPFRLADGVGRLSAANDRRLKGTAGAKAFAVGAMSQGWATWCWAIPALCLVGHGWAAACLGLIVGALARWIPMSFHWSVGVLSLVRYATFALQYLLMLSAWNVLHPVQWVAHGFPRIAAVWCAVGSIPWPAELGVREAAAAWVFDDNLPGVVSATFALWLLNRVGSALLGFIWVGQAWPSTEHPDA